MKANLTGIGMGSQMDQPSPREWLKASCEAWLAVNDTPMRMSLYGHPVTRDDLDALTDDEVKRIVIHGAAKIKKSPVDGLFPLTWWILGGIALWAAVMIWALPRVLG